MIVGQNSILNQYVPAFFIKDIRNGNALIYDSTRKAFINVDISNLISTTVGTVTDFIEYELYVKPRNQYLVTSRLEIIGHVNNEGRIAIL